MLINFPVLLFFRIHSAGYSVFGSCGGGGALPFGSNQRRAVIVQLFVSFFFLVFSQ